MNPSDPVYQWLSLRFPAMVQLLFADAPDPSRVVVFSSIGDAINDVVMTGGASPRGSRSGSSSSRPTSPWRRR